VKVVAAVAVVAVSAYKRQYLVKGEAAPVLPQNVLYPDQPKAFVKQ
jgi:hypothetical protein